MPALTTDSLRKSLFKMAAPTMLGALLQVAQGFIDLYWLKILDRTEIIAAISMSGVLIMTLFPVIMGVSTGTVAIVSRAIGCGNRDEAAQTAGQSLLLGLIMGLVAGVAGYFFADDMCRLLGANEAVVTLAHEYLGTFFLFSFTLFLMLMCSSIFQGTGNAKYPMYAALVSTTLNAVLDPVFIFGSSVLPAYGIHGAAIAAIIAQSVATVMLLYLLHQGKAKISIPMHKIRLTWAMTRRILSIGLPSSGQLLARNVIGLVLMTAVARYGTEAVAAYGIGLRFHMAMLMPGFVLGNAVAPIVGQNLGAALPTRAQQAAWLAAGVDLLIKLVIMALLVIFAGTLINSFDRNADVIRIGTHYLWIVTPFLLFAGIAIVLSRALQGAGDTLPPMIATIASLWGVQLPLAFILPHYFADPIRGVWWSISIATALHGILITAWFQTGRWKLRKV